MAVRTQLCHPRRREGDGPPDPAPPGDASARGGAGGRDHRRCARGYLVLGSGATLVILTGRTGLIALLCVLPIALSPQPAASFTVLLALLAAAVIADIGLAASPSRLLYTRLPNGSVRLGESVNLGLLIHNHSRRRFLGRVRDFSPPRARA